MKCKLIFITLTVFLLSITPVFSEVYPQSGDTISPWGELHGKVKTWWDWPLLSWVTEYDLTIDGHDNLQVDKLLLEEGINDYWYNCPPAHDCSNTWMWRILIEGVAPWQQPTRSNWKTYFGTVYDKYGGEEGLNSQTIPPSVTLPNVNLPPNTPYYQYNGTPVAGHTAVNIFVGDTEPEGDKIKFVMDWGDGATSETPLLSPSEAGWVNLTHKWTYSGVYMVKFRAVDEFNYESGESQFSVYVKPAGGGGGGNLRPPVCL